MAATVRLARDGTTATMIFDNRTRRNAMTVSMWAEVPELCAAVADDPQVRVVVLTGSGDEAFVAGADIGEFGVHRTPAQAPHYDQMTARAQESIRALPQPVVAKINGYCIGGGLALALSADVRFCSISATFGLPPARLGIGYSVDGVGALVDVVGPGPAAELLFAAEWIDAERAHRWGLVNDVVDDERLDEFVADWVRTVASRAPLSQRAAKAAIASHLAPGPNREERTARAQDLVAIAMASADYREGVAAFTAKRRPRFTGT